MICRDVFVIVLDQPLRRAVPNEMVCYAQDDEVIQTQAAPGIDGLSSPDLFFRNIPMSFSLYLNASERDTHTKHSLCGAGVPAEETYQMGIISQNERRDPYTEPHQQGIRT